MTTLTMSNSEGGTVTLETEGGSDIQVTVTYTGGRETTVCTCQDDWDDLVALYERTGYSQ